MTTGNPGYLWRVKDNNGNVRYMVTSSQTLTDGVEFNTGWIDEDGVFQVSEIMFTNGTNGDYYKYSVSGITTGETTVGPVNYNIPEYDIEFDLNKGGVETNQVIFVGNEFFDESWLLDRTALIYPSTGGNLRTVQQVNELKSLELEGIPATLKVTIKNCPGDLPGESVTFTTTIKLGLERNDCISYGINVNTSGLSFSIVKLPGDNKLYGYPRNMYQ
jgi:hypothetical protein